MSDITVEVRGTRYPVEVDAIGIFTVTIDGTEVRADSLAGLREKAMRRTGQADLGIAFTFYSEQAFHGEVWQGAVRRLHANGRDVLVTREGEGGGNLTIQTYDAKYMLQRLDEEESAELERLITAKREAEHALAGFREAHKRNIRREITEAQSGS